MKLVYRFFMKLLCILMDSDASNFQVPVELVPIPLEDEDNNTTSEEIKFEADSEETCTYSDFLSNSGNDIN